MTADELREVLKEDAKIDFVSDDNTGNFKTIIWRDADLEFLEEGSEKAEESTQKMVTNEDVKLLEDNENLVENPEILVENQEKLAENIEKLVEGMSVGKSRQRRLDILKTIAKNPNVSARQLAGQFGISITAVQNHLDHLKNNNLIRRVGPDKGGHWEVVGMSEKMSVE